MFYLSHKDGIVAYGENIVVVNNIIDCTDVEIDIHGGSNIIDNNLNIQQ